MSVEQNPTIFIDIQQPGDRGQFLVRVLDGHNKKLICDNRLQEERSYFEYVYTARLLEGGGMGISARDEALAEQQRKDRYQDLVRYGQRLYTELFGKGKQFKKYIENTPYLKNGAHLVLRLHNTASELWNIPWEYMHDGDNFIGIDKRFPIIRSLMDSRVERDFSEIPNPLKMLVVISTPRDVAPLNVEAEINMIRTAVSEAEASGRLQIDFVEDGRLEMIEAALAAEDYHILHYSGHGAMSSMGSLLVMENEQGLSRPVYLKDFLPIIERAKNLRFVFLSACRGGNIRETEATSGIATGLLKHVPAVLAMQFSIRDDRASTLSQAFYGSIGRGASLEDALHASRQAMNQSNQIFGDWGIPTLYLQKPNFRLIDSAATPASLPPKFSFDLSALPNPKPFVGRRGEQRVLRDALNNPKVAMSLVWGMAGYGKSALVRQIIERPGKRGAISDVLVLSADKLDAESLMQSFAQWLSKHYPAAKNILDKLPQFPDKAVEALSKQINDKPLVIVFDRLDALMRPRKTRQWDFADERLGKFVQALAQADWSIHCIVTSRFRWEALNQLAAEHIVELHLGSLIVPDAAFLIHSLPQLKALKPDEMNKLFGQVGGHPQTLHFLHDGMSKNPQANIINNPKLPQTLADFWNKRFLEPVFRLLSSEERDALRLLSIHHDVFNPRHVQLLVALPELADAERLMMAWESLSLALHIGLSNDGTSWYDIPQLIRSFITSQLDAEETKKLHAQVAKVLTEGFVLTAKQDFEERGGPQPIESEPLKTAMAHLQFNLSSGRDDIASRYLGLSYTWQAHYRKAEDYEKANQIALFLLPLLRSYGYTELMKTLYQETKANATNAIAMNLRYYEALLLIDEKKYNDALNLLTTIEKAVWDKTALRPLYAATIEAQAEIVRNQGQREEAYKKYRAALGHYDIMHDKPSMSRLRLYLGEHAFFTKDIPQARQHIETALQILQTMERHLTNPRVLGQLLLYRGHLQANLNADGEALKSYGTVFRIGRDIGDPTLIARGLENMGYIYGLLRQYHIAGQQLLQAMDIYEKINDMASLSLCLTKLAAIQFLQENKMEALPLCERAVRLAKDHAPANLPQAESLLKKIKGWRGLF
jgi:tetratricopeptide (TPR) repeat protein